MRSYLKMSVVLCGFTLLLLTGCAVSSKDKDISVQEKILEQQEQTSAEAIGLAKEMDGLVVGIYITPEAVATMGDVSDVFLKTGWFDVYADSVENSHVMCEIDADTGESKIVAACKVNMLIRVRGSIVNMPTSYGSAEFHKGNKPSQLFKEGLVGLVTELELDAADAGEKKLASAQK